MTDASPQVAGELSALAERIKELNEKFSQMLLFLSFAIVAAGTLNIPANATLLRATIVLLLAAVFPVLLGVWPQKERGWDDPEWYKQVRDRKVVHLRAAIVISGLAVLVFLVALTCKIPAGRDNQTRPVAELLTTPH